MVDEGHAGRFGDVLDRVAGLLLGADEQHGPAAVGERPGELLRLVQRRGGLEQIDDVDAATLTMDEAAHLGVPAACLVTEVNAGLQQLRYAYLSHEVLPLLCDWMPCGRSGPGYTTKVDDPGRAAILDPHGSKISG